jgi:amino acid transporter
MDMKRGLSLWGAVGLSIGLMAPTAAMALNGILPAQLVGRAVALTFLLALAGVICVAYGFVRLSQRFSHSGSVYALCGVTLGPWAGFLAGFTLLGVYVAFTIDAIPATALFASQFFDAAGFWHNASWPLLAAITAIGYAYFGTRRVRLTTRVLLGIEGVSVFLIIILMVVIFVRLATGHAPAGQHLTLTPFTPGPVGFGVIAAASVYGFLSWAGFEAAATLGEETVQPRRNIPRAFIGVLVFTGVFFVFCMWLQTLGFGTNAAGIKAFGSSSQPLGDLSNMYVGDWLRIALDAGAAVSLFASGLASAVGAARIAYALARDGFGPRQLATTSRADIPAVAVLAVVGIAVVADVVMYATGTTSALNQYYYAATVAVLGLLIVYAMASAGAIRYLFFRGERKAPLWELALPALGVIYLVYVFYKNVIPVPATVYKYFPYVVLAWLVIGLGVLVVRPKLAKRIGRSLSEDALGRAESEELSDTLAQPSG